MTQPHTRLYPIKVKPSSKAQLPGRSTRSTVHIVPTQPASQIIAGLWPTAMRRWDMCLCPKRIVPS
jgi:hypothetical protein